MEWFHSFLYLVFISIIAFPIGRMIPKHWIKYDCFPFTAYEWEDDGRIYNKIGIRKWMNKVPDMSRIFPKMMPPKRMVDTSTGALRRMIQETCTAELIHGLLCLTGFYCIALWPGNGGIILSVLNVVLFNLPFMLIQRYNRPRLLRLYLRQMEKEMLTASCQP